MITFTEARMRYADGTVALDGVSFAVPAGQFCVLLGSSGAGKSTLLKAVSGMLTLTGGEVSVAGECMQATNRARLQRRMAMIHQHFNLVARLSVEANIVSGAVAHLPLWRVLLTVWPMALRRRAALLAAEVGLTEEQFRRRCAELSGGQQQRVGVARAFLLQPQLVLADEPVASLDPASSEAVMDALQRKAAEHRTTVLCSLHQVELARAYADRIIGLRSGRIVFDGPPTDLSEADAQQLYQKVS